MNTKQFALLPVAVFSILFGSNAFSGGAQSNDATVTVLKNCPPEEQVEDSINDGLTCYSVNGWSKGNHEIDCTVIVPDGAGDAPPLLAWANGWDQGNVLGQCTTGGYLLGLKKWAHDGGYVVVAANQWSVQESDVLACAQWVQENAGNGIPAIDPENIGLVGHSQGGGAVIKAGDGNRTISIKAVLAMNPYGPAWVRPEDQTGQVLILGGRRDTTTPPESYEAVSEAILAQADPGGISAVSKLGTHNSDAWGTYDAEGLMTMSCIDAAEKDFGDFQDPGRHWWKANLENNAGAMVLLRAELCDDLTWEAPQHAGVEGFSDCP
jgi:hypothetical protein